MNDMTDCSANTVTRQRIGQLSKSSLGNRYSKRSSSTTPRPALRHTQPPTQSVPAYIHPDLRQPGREANHSSPSGTIVKKEWLSTSARPYAFKCDAQIRGQYCLYILVCVPRRIHPWDEWQAFRGVQCTHKFWLEKLKEKSNSNIQAKEYMRCIWHSEDRASWYILIIKPTRSINFSKFIFGIGIYMFRTVSLSIIRSLAMYTQQ